MQQRTRVAEQTIASLRPDTPQVLHGVAVHGRRDLALEIVLILDDARHHEPTASGARDLDCFLRTFVRMNSPKEQKVVLRTVAERECAQINPMMDGAEIR